MPHQLSELYKKFLGQDIYVIGTGASLRYYPQNFFQNKITIGLNQAYKYLSPTFSLTVHPYLIPIDKKEWNTKWITKVKKADHSWVLHELNNNHNEFYIFRNTDNWNIVQEPIGNLKNWLFVGRGIQTGGLHLAALMGAANAILVGCDMDALASEHHFHDQHIEPHQYNIQEVYDEYYFYTVKLRKELKRIYGMNILSMSPFLGLNRLYQDPMYLKQELNLPDLPEPKVIEYNDRKTNLVRDFIQ